MDMNQLFFARHLDDDEEVYMVVHKHWLLGIKHLFFPVCVFLGCWFVFYLLPLRPVFFAAALGSIASLVWLMRNFFDYYLDAWIITDQGIIDVEWHGWFHRQSTRVLYSDIQGVSYEIQGFFGTVLRYGEIIVEKISTGNEVALDHVANPRVVEALILENMEEYLHGKNLKDAKHVQEILAGLIAREVQLEDFEDEEEDDDDQS